MYMGSFSQSPSMATFHPWTSPRCCGTELIPEKLNGSSKIAMVMSSGNSPPTQTSSCLIKLNTFHGLGKIAHRKSWNTHILWHKHILLFSLPRLWVTGMFHRPWKTKRQNIPCLPSITQPLRTPLNRVYTLKFSVMTHAFHCTLEPGPHAQHQQFPCFPLWGGCCAYLS